MRFIPLFALNILVIFCALASATIINIPDDYGTIQEGIDTSVDGDTVLVQSGTYYEHITFMGKSIIVASMYLTTGDSIYISETIIDGSFYGTIVRFENEEDRASALLGFTIQNGHRGVRCQPGTGPMISNNIIRFNSDDSNGGGIYCSMSYPVIKDNIITENTATRGGGIFCRESSAIITGNIIIDNHATAQTFFGGGGIYCEENENALIYINSIIANTANDGGGIYCYSNSNLQISNNLFRHNIASRVGGSVYILGSGYQFNNNLFIQNSAVNGGAICIFDSSSCSFINNVSWGNSAGYGGAVYCGDSNPIFLNCILWNDTAFYGDEIYAFNNDNQLEPEFSYCDIEGGWEGEGNIDVDPLFRDPENGDFHLMAIDCDDQFDSPCIDAGHPDSLDLVLDCMWGLGNVRADMGAYGGGDSAQVGIDDETVELPRHFALMQNYPNPFNPSTTIKYDLPEPSFVTLNVYDILGRKVVNLVDDFQQAGNHRLIWKAGRFSSGIYFYKLQAGDYSETKKMLLVK